MSRSTTTTNRAPTQEDEDLPGYSPRTPPSRNSSQSARSQTEHTYHLKNRNDQPWLTLRLSSQASRAQSLPIFCKEDTLAGSVDLFLTKSDHIQATVLRIWGQVMAPGKPNIVFWEDVHTLWDVNMGDPVSPSKDYQGAPWSPKLSGSYSWDYSIQLPSEIQFATKDASSPSTVPLPQSFAGQSHISYRLEVCVLRGKLRPDSKCGTNFSYIPRTRAAQPSELRRLAYQDGTRLLGPEVDPEGWHVLRPAWVAGTLFNSRKVEVFWKLAVANPLEFARGTVIPLSLTLESDDSQALDLLAKPSVPTVALMSEERWDHETSVSISDGGSSERGPLGREQSMYMMMQAATLTPQKGLGCAAVNVATWWAPDDAAAYGERTRRLDGEIHLPGSLSPTFHFWKIGVEYKVHLLPPSVTGFTLETGSDVSLVSVDVKIATDRSLGPAPRRNAPPGYADDKGDVRLQKINSAFFGPRVGKFKGGGFL